MKKNIILIIALCLSACGLKSANDNQGQKSGEKNGERYGEKVFYADGKELKFPDFSITFNGKREVPNSSGNPAIRIIVYDFLAMKNGKTQTVSWSSGTGDIMPTSFNVDGIDYLLELGLSDVIEGSLGEGNLVVWKKADFEEAKKKR